MTTEQIPVALLAHATLVHYCRHESQRFFQQQPNDTAFCYELFRRAILTRDQAAWSALYAQYTPLAMSWVERHASFARCNEDALYFVNRAFEKMWSALTPDRFAGFGDLKALLRYLQLCVHSVVIDYTRSSQPTVANEPEASGPGLEHAVLDALTRNELWQRIGAHLNDSREEQLLYYRYALGLKPREICQRFGVDFPDVGEVYVMTQNILARLRRDEELRRFFIEEYLSAA